MTDDRRRVLFICTANICRSPTAELLARHRYGENEMVFRSAGFLERDRGCPDDMVTAMAEVGIVAADHRSYRLDEASLDAADLVLTMEGRHVQEATVIDPRSFSKIVPLREAASFLAEVPDPAVPVQRLLTDLNQDRDPRDYLDERWDVADPYGGRLRAYRKAVAEIDRLVSGVIGRLT